MSGLGVGAEVRFEIPSFKIRQELARGIYKQFGFESHVITFDKPSPIFTVKYALQNLALPCAAATTTADEEAEHMLAYEMGFSTVIRELIKHRKPFVGHNMFLDMLFIYS